MAASMSQLMRKLTDREQEKLIAQQEASAGIQACQQAVNEASEELMEFKRGKEQELQVLKTQYEKQLRDTAFSCRQRVQARLDALAETQGRLEASEGRKRDLESQVSHLRMRVMELEECMQQRREHNDGRLASLSRSMEARMTRVTNQTDTRIQRMSEHALMLRESMYTGVEVAQEELRDQTARAHVRAEGRTRFRELCSLAQRTKSYSMSPQNAKVVQDELLALWRTQASMHTGIMSSSPRAIALSQTI